MSILRYRQLHAVTDYERKGDAVVTDRHLPAISPADNAMQIRYKSPMIPELNRLDRADLRGRDEAAGCVVGIGKRVSGIGERGNPHGEIVGHDTVSAAPSDAGSAFISTRFSAE